MPQSTRPAAKPKPERRSGKKPNGESNDDVARRAYEIFESRGRAHGSDLDHWLEAERELKAKPGSVTVPTKPRKPKVPLAGV